MSSEGFPGLVSRRLNERSAICPIAIDLRCTILHSPALVHLRMQATHESHRRHRTPPSGVLRRSMLALRHSTSACGLHCPLNGQCQTRGTMQHCPKKKEATVARTTSTYLSSECKTIKRSSAIAMHEPIRICPLSIDSRRAHDHPPYSIIFTGIDFKSNGPFHSSHSNTEDHA